MGKSKQSAETQTDEFVFITDNYFYSIEPVKEPGKNKQYKIYRGGRIIEVKSTLGGALSLLMEAIGPGTYKKI